MQTIIDTLRQLPWVTQVFFEYFGGYFFTFLTVYILLYLLLSGRLGSIMRKVLDIMVTLMLVLRGRINNKKERAARHESNKQQTTGLSEI